MSLDPETPTRDNNDDMDGIVDRLSNHLGPIPQCTLRPHSLFVAWNGVLVLVYEGFPPSLCRIKEGLKDVVPALKAENFGSKWPKTTLAAVKEEELVFSSTEFQDLKGICQKYSHRISNTEGTTIHIQRVSAVQYSRRSLEELTSQAHLVLEESNEEEESATEEQKAIATGVVKEWDDEKGYLPKINAPGSRISSYRESSPSGATCVAFLDPLPPRLANIVSDFRVEIEERFPSRYVWLKESSLHCTLRSLALI